jgi:hypothetical protein
MLKKATLTMAGVFTPSINGKKESSIAILVSKGQEDLREIGRLESRDAVFAPDGTSGHLNLTLELPPDVRESADFEIRLVIDNSKDYGRLTLEKFSLDAAGNPDNALADASWLAGQVEELTRRLGAASWKEGSYPVCRSIRVSGPGGQDAKWPVFVARDGRGSPIAEFFDGRIERPALSVDPDSAVELYCGAGRSDPVLGVRLAASRLGTLRLGELPIALNMSVPAGATATLDASGGVRLSHTPLFEQPLSPGAREISEGELLKKAGEPCLSCRGTDPCALEYTYESGLPMTGLKLMFYPRVFANWRFSNRIQVHYSLDGGPFKLLYSFRGSASGTWEGLNVPRTVHKTFASPGKKLKLRYTLSGDGAQLWSSQDYPMRLSVVCTSLSPPAFPAICPIKVATDTPVDAFAALCRNPASRESLWRPF